MKVFCIGCHKTGTSSLEVFAKSVNLKTIHSCDWSTLNPTRSVLSKFDFFCDGGGHFWDPKSDEDPNYWGKNHNISFLYDTYKDNCKFILNTRQLQDWLQSKMTHAGWRSNTTIRADTDNLRHDNWKYKSINVIKEWIINRTKYHQQVINFFSDRGISDQLLIIDYINDLEAEMKIAEFLGKSYTEKSGKFHRNPSSISGSDKSFILNVLDQVFTEMEITDRKRLL